MTTYNDDRRAAELRAQGESWREIPEAMEGSEPTNADGTPLSALAQQANLRAQRTALGASGVPDVALHPGDEVRFAGGGDAGRAAAGVAQLRPEAGQVLAHVGKGRGRG